MPASLAQVRNRLLADPRFQFWSARFWPTRRIAARRARALFDLCAGFVYSQTLQACVKLDVFERLAEGPLPMVGLATRIGLPIDATERLVNAAVSIRLLERTRDDRVALGIHGAALRANPAIPAMIKHNAMLYRDLLDPVALLRDETGDTELSRYWAYAREAPTRPIDATRVEAYSRLMADTLSLVLDDTLAAVRGLRFERWTDVGGGEGGFACALARRFPHGRFTVFDLPAVVARANERIGSEGLARQVSVVGGDFRHDPLPAEADVISLIRVLHDHDDATASALLAAAARALKPGGHLLLAEPMADDAGRDPMAHAYFGFYLLAMGSGRPRSPGRIEALLAAAGFKRRRRLHAPRPLLTNLMLASR